MVAAIPWLPGKCQRMPRRQKDFYLQIIKLAVINLINTQNMNNILHNRDIDL